MGACKEITKEIVLGQPSFSYSRSINLTLNVTGFLSLFSAGVLLMPFVVEI